MSLRADRATSVDRPVVHVIDTLEVGGAQQLLVTFADEARARGVACTVVALRHDDEQDVSTSLRRAGATVVALAGPGEQPGLATSLWRLVRLVRGLRPRVVQSHLTRSNSLVPVATRLTGTSSVVTLHSQRPGGDGNSARALWLETQVLRRLARTVVAVGDGVEHGQRERLAPRRALVVRNATPPGRQLDGDRAAVRAAVAGDADVPLVLAVGRLTEAKGYHDLLAAFEVVAASSPAVLAVVGAGELHDELHRRVTESGLAERVRLLGQRSDVPTLLAAADVYVGASHWEGLPVALLEAMAAGLPVVPAAVGDVGSVVDGSTGRLVTPRQPAQLVEALLDLLGDPAGAAALGAAGRARIEADFGVAGWFDRLLDVYDDDLRSTRSRSRA